MKWEYKSIKYTKRSFLSGQINLSELDKKLDNLGSEGWELVNINVNALGGWGGIFAVFKRQV